MALCSGIGIVYSGTLAYQKLTTGVCVFGTSCPYLLGLPVCVYGLVGFLVVHALASAVLLVSRESMKRWWTALFWFSLAGMLFALYYLVQELFFLPRSAAGGFSFPSCLPGTILFGIIFVFAKQSLAHWGEYGGASKE